MPVISRIVQAACLAFVLAACASPQRYRWPLTDQPDLPADVRRQIDSIHAAQDSIHRCPDRADTLWAGNPRAPIPQVWLEASVTIGCRSARLPNAVRRRLRDDPASLPFYEAVARGESGRDEMARATAVEILGYSGRRRYFPLLLRIASEETPALEARDYNAAWRATIALAPYLYESRAARRTVLRHAGTTGTQATRTAGVRALTIANTPWSRSQLASISLDGLDEYDRTVVRLALAYQPCRPGTVFVEHHGVEGQDFSGCEPPPDLR